MPLKGRSGANAPGKLLRKYFGDIEVAEAKKPLTLFPNWDDFKHAIKHDPHSCGFAKCAARITGASSALFFKKAVYIDHFGPDGVRRAYRYKADIHIYRVLSSFDKGKIKEGDVLKEFVLKPPPKSDQLVEKRKTTERWKKTSFGKATAALESARMKVVRLNARKAALEDMLQTARNRSPLSTRTQGLKKEFSAVKQDLMKARDTFDKRRENMIRVRDVIYATGTPKPRKYDVDVRSGSRYFSLLK